MEEKIRASERGVSIVFFALATINEVLSFLVPSMREALRKGSLDAVILWYVIALVVPLGFGLSCLRCFYLTPEGILHTWCGIRYRMTPWGDVESVMQVRFWRNCPWLWVTKKGVKRLLPEPNGYMSGGSFRDNMRWLAGDYFRLSDRPEVVAYVEKYHGKLAFYYEPKK